MTRSAPDTLYDDDFFAWTQEQAAALRATAAAFGTEVDSTAQGTVEDDGLRISAPTTCPFALDECLTDDFDLDAAIAKLAATPRPDVA